MSRALFLTVDLPFPANDPEKRREAHLIQILSEQMPVEVLCLGSGTEPQDTPVPVTTIDPRGEGFLGKQAINKGLAQLKPRELRKSHSSRMEQALRTRAPTDPKTPTLLWISRLEMAQYVPLARKLGFQIILDKQTAEADALMDGALSSVRKFLGIFRAAQTTYLERGYCERCDLIVASSDLHASRLLKLAPGAPVRVIPNSVNAADYSALRSQPGNALVFIGALDNTDTVVGLTRFADKVMPRLKAGLGEQMPRVIVAGSDPAPEFAERLRDRGIEVQANPESSLPWLREAAVVFAPNPRGAEDSTQSILEAMAAGRAVVATVHAIEGLVLSPTYDIWVAERKDQFASLIVRLFEDTELRRMTGERAAQTVESRYDWRCTRLMIENLLFSLRNSGGRAATHD